MKIKYEKNALLESKAIIKDYAEDVMNYGSKNAIFAAAEESHSFRKEVTEYVLVFRTESGLKEFKVSRQIYDHIPEGTVGDLYYCKNSFHDFKKPFCDKL